MKYVNVYSMSREYGGPEEGGWWFDTWEPVASVPCEEDKIEETKARLSKSFPKTGSRNSVAQRTEDFAVCVEDHYATAGNNYAPYE